MKVLLWLVFDPWTAAITVCATVALQIYGKRKEIAR